MISPGRRLWMILEFATAVVIAVILALGIVIRYLMHSAEKSLKGKVVLVTSCSSLGRELSKQLVVQHGCRVASVFHSPPSCLENAKEIHSTELYPSAKSFTCNLTKHNEVLKLFQKVTEEFGNVDILIDNTGVGEKPVPPETELSRIEDLVNVSLMSNLNILLAFLPGMISRDEGHVVTMTSSPGCLQYYSSTKVAVLDLMNTLCLDLRQHSTHINVTSVTTTKDNISNQMIAEGVIKALVKNKRNVKVPDVTTQIKQFFR